MGAGANNKVSTSLDKKVCTCCGQEKRVDKEYYNSNSLITKFQKVMPICKSCCLELYDFNLDKYKDEMQAVYYTCERLDVYFELNLFNSALEQSKQKDSNAMAIYIQKVNSLKQYQSKTFLDGERLNDIIQPKEDTEIYDIETTDDDKKNEEDVKRLLGKDPFENENPLDKKYLYNTLIDYLDESTLMDSFKIPAVIEIVKSFNQIDKINIGLTSLTSDVENITKNVGGLKSLMDAKKQMLSAILALAKDNGISVNHNTNKSKGANTLNGTVKKLNEIGLSAAELNLFDLETCNAMKQIADFSNRSILDQLMCDENDFTDMLAQQRDLIKKLDDDLIKTKEENRLLKVKYEITDKIDK
jgi:hypothetical protein